MSASTSNGDVVVVRHDSDRAPMPLAGRSLVRSTVSGRMLSVAASGARDTKESAVAGVCIPRGRRTQTRPGRQRVRRVERLLLGGMLFLTGYACGGGGAGVVAAAMNLIELGGESLAERLRQAGDPPITPGFGVAERVPDDGTRHFSVTIATQNRQSLADSAALYALMDGHGPIGEVWGANVLAFAHSDMTSGAVQGLEVDVGNLGTATRVPVSGINVFAMGAVPSDVALGILNATEAAGPGGFREGIAFHSNAPGVAVTEALIRVHPGFGTAASGIDLREAAFSESALATPGFSVGPDGQVASARLATGRPAFVCVDAEGRLFPSASPCVE